MTLALAYPRLLLLLATLESGAAPRSQAVPAGHPRTPIMLYQTDFDRTETLISEGGVWSHSGLDWTTVATANGLAIGTQTGGVGRFDDSYAFLSGFPADQAASVVIHKDPKLDTTTQHEVEILLRWADSADAARGYECNLSYDGAYAEIVRWNGAYGDFTYVTPQGSGGPGSVHDGDIFTAQIVGNTITTALNGIRLAQAKDSKWSTGNPGIGLFRNGQAGAFPGDYCLTRFSATANPSAVPKAHSTVSVAVAIISLGFGLLVLIQRRWRPSSRRCFFRIS